MTVEPRLVPACELSRFFRQADLRDLGPLAVASLPPGHGVRGWLAMGRPAALGGGFSGERLRLLEGLAYRTAMALERERLARYQQQSLQVADALLDYARALARIEPGDDARDGASSARRRRSSARRTCRCGCRPRSVASLLPLRSRWTTKNSARQCSSCGSRPSLQSHSRDAQESFVLKARGIRVRSPAPPKSATGRDVAIAPFALDGAGWASSSPAHAKARRSASCS